MSFLPSDKATPSTPSSLTKTENEQTSDTTLQRRQLVIRAGVIAAVITFSVLVLLNADKLRQLGSYGYVGVFVLSFLTNATIVVPVPSWIIPIVAGTTLNPLIVGLVVGTGESLGELTGFAAGASGRIVVQDRERYQWLSGLANRYGLWMFIVLGFIPNPFFDLAGIMAGALRIPVLSFLAATWLGKTARAILLAYGGYRIFGQWLGL
jgi:membrane protein YqaA with SNARE-associated domain